MKQRIIFLGLLHLFASTFAQTEGSKQRFVGVQANQLIRQIFPFGTGSAVNSNPFLLSYSKSNEKGKGISLGTGFGINSVSTNDGVSLTEVTNRNLTFRIGHERKFFLTEKWIPFFGPEFHLGGTHTSVFTQQFQTIGQNISRVSTTSLFFGPAFRAGLFYAVNNRICLGTEAFFNAKISYLSTTSITDIGLGQVASNPSVSFPIDLGISVPTALFLVVRY